MVRDVAELETLRLRAKLTACPHCGQIGTLNAHGFLRGYAVDGASRVVRGGRFYCSERFRRPGCGRTFSLLLARFLGGFMVVTATLWSFVSGVLGGLCRKVAWEKAGSSFSRSTGYRLWRRLQLAQVNMRSCLSLVSPAPACADREPLAQLVLHIREVVPRNECEFAAFQYRFQRHLLG